MKTITDKAILDRIVEGLCGDTNWEGVAYASYDDPETDIYIEANVKWETETSENWITIDGRSYHEGTYCDVVGWDDLNVDAWIGQDKVDVDFDYIEEKLNERI